MLLNVDPKVDYAFKHAFGRDAARPILINVLDAVLDWPSGHQVEAVDLQNPFNPKETDDGKLSVLDIKARDQAGRQFNVEMQMLAFPSYEQRILFYWSKLYQQQLHEGQDYLELKPTISISFLNYVLLPNAPHYHSCFLLLEKTQHFPLTDNLEVHILELPKFMKTLDELKSDLDIWLYFLRHAATMDLDALPAVFRQRPLVLRALEDLKMLMQTPAEREHYEARRKAQLDWNTSMKGARLEGLAEGRAEGRSEGLIGMIHFCERLLQRPETPIEQLTGRSIEDLTRLADALQAELQAIR